MVLKLSKATKVRSLSVRLLGYADIEIGGGNQERTVTLDRSVVVDEGGQELAKGSHTFYFSIALPSSTASCACLDVCSS